MRSILSVKHAGGRSVKAERNGDMREAERNFLLKTLFSACVSLAFSVIGYLLLGPLGVIAQAALFLRRFWQDYDHFLLTERV